MTAGPRRRGLVRSVHGRRRVVQGPREPSSNFGGRGPEADEGIWAAAVRVRREARYAEDDRVAVRLPKEEGRESGLGIFPLHGGPEV